MTFEKVSGFCTGFVRVFGGALMAGGTAGTT
jgi:hypothetical protein